MDSPTRRRWGDRVSRITVTPTKTDPNAMVEFLDGDDVALTDAAGAAGFQVNLDVGNNVIRVKVSSADGTATRDLPGDGGTGCNTSAPPRTFRAGSNVWSATMTVGFDDDDPDYLGFNRVDVPHVGMLSDETFDYRGISYTIDSIANQLSQGNLSFDTRTAFPEAILGRLRLHICGETFELANRFFEFDSTYIWRPGNFNWSRGITVSVALSAEPSSDAALSGLKLEESAGTAITLNQPFAFYRTDYTASVANSISRVTVTRPRRYIRHAQISGRRRQCARGPRRPRCRPPGRPGGGGEHDPGGGDGRRTASPRGPTRWRRRGRRRPTPMRP